MQQVRGKTRLEAKCTHYSMLFGNDLHRACTTFVKHVAGNMLFLKLATCCQKHMFPATCCPKCCLVYGGLYTQSIRYNVYLSQQLITVFTACFFHSRGVRGQLWCMASVMVCNAVLSNKQYIFMLAGM